MLTLPAIIIAIALAVVVVVVVVDLTGTPALDPKQDACLMDRNILLPDRCLCSREPRPDCTATTRPYLIFFTQSATCVTLGCVQLP